MTKLVHHAERCPANPKLAAFIAWWQVNGPFPIAITSGDRTPREQLKMYAIGRTVPDVNGHLPGKTVTNARTPEEAPHCRRGALDASPVRETLPSGGVKTIYLGDEADPLVRMQALARLEQMADLAEQHGLQSGRNFPGLHDRPHIQDPAWRTLPVIQDPPEV